MKNILRYTAMALLVLLTASCAKEALEKAEVEAGFAPKAELPSITISSDVIPHPQLGTATVTITVEGASNLEKLEVGVLTSKDDKFESTSYVGVKNPGNGTFTVEAKANAGMTNYFKACVGCTSGSAYSQMVKVDVPDIPFIYKAAGKYIASNVPDAWDEPHNFEITIVPDEADPEHKCLVLNLAAYFAESGLTADRGFNIFEGIVDCDKCTITVPNYQLIGYNELYLISFPNGDMEEIAPLTLTFDQTAEKCVCTNAWGIYEDGEGGGWWDLYLGPITFIKR